METPKPGIYRHFKGNRYRVLGVVRHADLRQFTSLLPDSSVAASVFSPLAVHYGPAENLEHLDIGLIQQSRDHLDIAIYAFTDQAVAHAIVDVANRGVPVRIYRDQQQYEQELERNTYIAQLFQGNRNIQVRVKNSRELMHLKQWCNGSVLRDGSANFSPSALKNRQDNTVVISKDKAEIQAFSKNFDALWNRRDNRIVQ
jgi:phosphatidylserine/phosphatidylglycerophosphate/cardiolipin synthase-like enzyme